MEKTDRAYNRLMRILLIWLSVVTALAQGIPGVVADGAKVELVQEGFVFTEGPVGTTDGGLYFSDLQTGDKTYHMDPGGKISVYRDRTNGTLATGRCWERKATVNGSAESARAASRRRSQRGSAACLSWRRTI